MPAVIILVQLVMNLVLIRALASAQARAYRSNLRVSGMKRRQRTRKTA